MELPCIELKGTLGLLILLELGDAFILHLLPGMLDREAHSVISIASVYFSASLCAMNIEVAKLV